MTSLSISDFLHFMRDNNGLLVLLLAAIAFLGRRAKNALMDTIHAFRADTLAMSEKIAERRGGQIECMTRALGEVKAEVVTVGVKVEAINGTVGKSIRRLDRLEGHVWGGDIKNMEQD